MTWSAVQTLIPETPVLAGEVSVYSDDIGEAAEIALELVVSAAPRAATPVRVTVQESLDGTNWSEPRIVRQFVEVSRAGRYVMAAPVSAPHSRYAISPLNYGLTASLNGVPR